MNRLAGAVLFGLALIAVVLAIAVQRLSTYLPLGAGNRVWPNGAPDPNFPLWGWGVITLGLVIGFVLLVYKGGTNNSSLYAWQSHRGGMEAGADPEHGPGPPDRGPIR
jgi:hypothetical protein